MTTAVATRPVVARGTVRLGPGHALPSAPIELDEALLAALPAARRVLEIGATGHALRQAHVSLHPGCRWFDSVEGTEPFDLIVVSDGLQRLADPLLLLRDLAACATPDAALVLSVDNSARFATLEQLLEADFSESDDGPFAPGSLRHFSPASAYKLLMDAGWMPTLAGQRNAPPPRDTVRTGLHALADALGVPRATAERSLRLQRLVIEARLSFGRVAPAPQPALFTVVVPTTREQQLRLNIEASPGLREVDAQVIAYRGAADPAEALAAGAAHAESEWLLFCHQDVYFPSGFGQRLNELLAAVPADERRRTLIGFAGMAVNATRDGVAPAGFVIDRLSRFDQRASSEALSIDELAIVVARDSVHRIDPRLGWHLWATDLCLEAITQHQVFARIVRLPLFHNSLNDHVLPASFHASAAVLADKHAAAFGPIPTLCGTIDAKFLGRSAAVTPVVAAAATVPADDSPNLVLDPVTQEVDAFIAAGQHDAALTAIYQGVHRSYLQPGVKHRKLYYPAFDRQVSQLAEVLGREPGTMRRGAPGVPLIIATELYDLGGHSRVLEEISHEMHQPVLVLTDLFRTYHRDPAQLDKLRQRFAHTQLVGLPDAPLWEKCRMLRELVLRLAPRCTLYVGHHQDPIPFVATLAQPGPRRLFLHHGDHNPSLGNTIPGLTHVDFTTSLHETCTAHLDAPPVRLPLFVADQGRKVFDPVRGRAYSVATSGHPAKFARRGAQALQDIVATALGTIEGRFFHIGPLDEGWAGEIRAHLSAQGIAPERFVTVGLVPSVWQALKGLDAAVYIGSAPVSGGRAGIEAQGCGYPVLCFRGFEPGSLLADYSSYADPVLGWADLGELATRLAEVGDRHVELSAGARRFYEAEFSRTRFRRVLKGLLG